MERIKVIKGDITKLAVDAIVNAANSSLLGGGGVDGAIHRAGGAAILEDCMEIRKRQGGCKTGEAVITTAGKMPATHVIHTVGPVWNGDKRNEAQLLAKAYRNSLQIALENGLKTIAFPNISTGIYGYPKLAAAAIATKTVVDFLEENKAIESVIFVCFDAENYEIYQQILY
ncbi:MAG: O-acetyl-ADP-ribose deacetylase [Chitinophagales bacterium]